MHVPRLPKNVLRINTAPFEACRLPPKPWNKASRSALLHRSVTLPIKFCCSLAYIIGYLMYLWRLKCSNPHRFIGVRIQSLIFRHSLSITVLTHAPNRVVALVSRDWNGRPGAGPMGVVRLVFSRSMAIPMNFLIKVSTCFWYVSTKIMEQFSKYKIVDINCIVCKSAVIMLVNIDDILSWNIDAGMKLQR